MRRSASICSNSRWCCWCRELCCSWTGLYRGVWRFASLPDLWNILRAAVFGAHWPLRRPCSCTTAWPACRVRCCCSTRWFLPSCSERLDWPTVTGRTVATSCSRRSLCKRVLIVGADRAGEALSRDVQRDNGYTVVGFRRRQAKPAWCEHQWSSGAWAYRSIARTGARSSRRDAADRHARRIHPGNAPRGGACAIRVACLIAPFPSWKTSLRGARNSTRSRKWRSRICWAAIRSSWTGRPFAILLLTGACW